MSDAIDERLDEGVKVILGMGGERVQEYISIELNRWRLVPVVLVFTKFDEIVTKVLSDIRGSDSRYDYESARSTAHTIFEGSCRSLFRRNPKEVPAEVVSSNHSFVFATQKACLTPWPFLVGPRFIDLIDKLVTKTNVVINAHSHHARALSEAQLRMSLVSLAWSVSQRASCDVTIRAVIECVISFPYLNSSSHAMPQGWAEQ